MSARQQGTKNAALTDQILAVLRDADGFPIGTGEIARSLGDRMVSWPSWERKPIDRPQCWPDDYEDEGLTQTACCYHCGGRFHRQPVWRGYQAQDIRPLLNRLVRQQTIEKIVPEGSRAHYWRAGSVQPND